MTPVRIVFPGRSDGIHSGPSAAQLEHKRSGNATQFYAPVAIGDDKSKDWRKKLGGMVIQQHEKVESAKLGTEFRVDSDPNMIYMLHEFPTGYHLYEHHTVHDGEGARDRRDTYLYGHPGGVKKRFRTPKEFFLHLWWLLTDDDGNTENCACKLCVSDELLREVEAFVGQSGQLVQPGQSGQGNASGGDGNLNVPTSTSAPIASAAQPPTASSHVASQLTPNGSSSAPTTPSIPTSSISVQVPAPTVTTAAPPSRPSTAQPIQRTPQPRPSSSGRPAPQSKMIPSELPQPLNTEQSQDTAVGGFIFRIGELVWYPKGAAVGLAVIKGRRVAADTMSTSVSPDAFYYILQPLSYPDAAYDLKEDKEARLKPWYAYSPPGATHAYLNQADVAGLSFDRINWQAVLSGDYGAGDADVDASIFAAKTIDRSYTPFEFIKNTGTHLHYNGIYLGAEKVWRGDAVTLRGHTPPAPGISQPLEILMVTDIVETPQAASTPPGRPAPATSVQLFGDRYTYTSVPISVPPDVTDRVAFLTSRIPTPIKVLPTRVAEDLQFQNRVSVMKKQIANSWRLTATQAVVSVAEVRGRWYETARMLPIIMDRDRFEAMRDVAGEIHDVGRNLNARGEAGGTGQNGSPGVRYASRIDVLSRSVVKGFALDSAA